MADIAVFRADFKAAFAHWQAAGEISEAEAAQQYREAAKAVQNNMHDAKWMEGAALHFKQLVSAIDSARAKSRQIANEVRAEREKA